MLRIGLVFSSMDRYELVRMSLICLLEGVDPDQHALTVLWQDGSSERDAKRFWETFNTDKARLIKHGGTHGLGAARAIDRGMKEILTHGPFDWVGTVESDVYLRPNWLRELFTAHDAAQEAGFIPGILTPYVLHGWVVEYHERFVTMWNVGAACSLFKPEVWKLVPPIELGHRYPTYVQVQLGHPAGHVHAPGEPRLGWDWSFAPTAYHAGFDSIGTRASCMYNCGVPDRTKQRMRGYSYVEEHDVPMWSGEGPVRLGKRDYEGWMEALATVESDPPKHSPGRQLRRDLSFRLRALRSMLTGK
jgi:hypothetical protein